MPHTAHTYLYVNNRNGGHVGVYRKVGRKGHLKTIGMKDRLEYTGRSEDRQKQREVGRVGRVGR